MAPSKNKLSIPKKELNAVLLGCIKGDYLVKNFNVLRKMLFYILTLLYVSIGFRATMKI